MSVEQTITQGEPFLGKRLRHSMILLIFLDLITLGLYSAARCYLVHAEISQKTGRRPFSLAFLHVLIVLNLLLWTLRFSRENLPMDLAVIMARLGAGLLLITLLLILRRQLCNGFQLRASPLPLAIFGFWYLQYRINRHRPPFSNKSTQDSWMSTALVIIISLMMSLASSLLKPFRVANSTMEPTLVAGDHVLVEQLSFALNYPIERGDLLFVNSQSSMQVKRVLGLPGDRLRFHGTEIYLNGRPLNCSWVRRENPERAATDQTLKQIFRCDVDRRSFTLQRYEAGASTALEGDFEVPQGHYFMMVDNVDHSSDSRTAGPVLEKKILGRVHMTTVSYRLGEPIPWDRWFQLL